ncbi:cupredoxin domain-containing protein [Candidatus Giovannonibacteria bacterium]|nr:cupredoxin domain-containing protein [Candidatus Giovannonibacteria bacterium]
MNKILVIILVVFVIIAGGWYLYSNSSQKNMGISSQPDLSNKSNASENAGNTNSSGMTGNTTGMMSEEMTVEMMSNGFSPSTVNITAGTKINFVNRDSKPHWPASGPHPAHTCYAGFDALRGVNPGETYSFTFNEKNSCGFHDHLNTSIRGTVTVE